jgi:rubredoxin
VNDCPVCDGPGVLLGDLGNLTHYRCRNCGMQFSTERPTDIWGEPLSDRSWDDDDEDSVDRADRYYSARLGF